MYHGNAEGLRQPGSVHLSSNGLLIYNRNELPLYQLVEFTMELPDPNDETLTCTCMVAKTTFDSGLGLHKIWMNFLDVPDSACNRIDTLTETSRDLCPFCENS